jgi:hypothetical protein
LAPLSKWSPGAGHARPTVPEVRSKRPIGYIVILVLVGLYLSIRLVEAVVCVGDWLFDWGTCTW